MKMTREKKILLSLMLCGAVCNAAYAETYDITEDETWNIPKIENDDTTRDGLASGDAVTIEKDATLTINVTDPSVGGVGTGVVISGSGSLELVTQTVATGSGISSSGAAVTIDGLESISISGDVDVPGSGFAHGISVNGGGTVTIGGDGGESAVGTLDITSREEGIHINGSQGGGVTINAGTVNLTHSGSDTGHDGILIGASGSMSDTPDYLQITAKNISINNYRIGIRNQGQASVTIDQTGSGGSLNITNFSQAGIETDGGTTVINSEGTINITGDGTATYGIYSSGAGALTINSSGDIIISNIGSEGAGICTQTNANALTIQGLNGNNVNSIAISGGWYGIRGRSSNGLYISDVTTMTIYGNFDYGIRGQAENSVNINNVGTLNIINDSWGIYPSAENAVNITNSGAVNFEKNEVVGIYSATTNGVNITNAETVTFDGNGEGIDTTVQNGVNITASGEVTFKDNGYGIFTTAENGVSITGIDNAPITKLTFDGNMCGMAAGNYGSLNFNTKELVATGGENIAYTGAYGEITLTAESTTISGQQDGGNGISGSFEADTGGTITLTTDSINASRTDGKYLAYVADEDSSISITANTGTITGAFWTKGSDDDPESMAAGKLALDLGTDTSWTITQDSKLTDLTLGDASALAFASAGDGSWANLYTNNLYSNAAGSTISMNIDGTQLNQSDHIYIMGEHTGTSSIILNNTNGQDFTDDVIGTKLVSVGTESGKFTSGGVYEGALKWYDYTIDSVNTADGEKTITDGKTVSTTNGYGTDWYISSYTEADDGNEGDKDTEPGPAQPPDDGDGGDGGDGGPGPAQPNGNTTTVNTVIASNAVNYYAFRETDKLLRRMGELRNNGEDEQGVWIRVKGAKTGRDNSFENKYTHYEMGYDQLVKNDHREKRYEGFSLSYMEGDVKYSGVSGSGKAHDEEIAFYRVDQYTHGHYLDLVARIGMYSNRFGVYDTNLNKIHGKNDTYGISMSAEYGRKKDYAHGWYIEPQGQLTIGYLSGNDYTTSNQVDVNNGSISSLVGRIGANFGKNFGREKKGIVYLKANWLHEFLGSYSIDMVSNAGNRVHAHGDYRDNWFEYGLGVAYKYTKNNFVYADIERTAGSDYYKNWAWNVGLRWTFN